MVPNQYSLTWDSYKSSICNGFSSLQQNGEFVDMTLAADGHLVKVHQILIALASPYLKELISSVPSQHPVIFLNNVPHAILGLLLEYIYTGEVLVPSRHLQSFMEAAKALHIKGLETISSSYYPNVKMPQTADDRIVTHSQVKRGIPLDIHSVQTATSYELPAAARKISVRPEQINVLNMKKEDHGVSEKDEYNSYTETVMDVSMDQASDDENDNSQVSHISANAAYDNVRTDDDDDNRLVDDNMQDSNQMDIKEKVSSNTVQFTVSIRGSLQVILNRYMYNLNSTAHQSGVKRWRCIDYRNKKCPASLVTKGNIVLSRHCLHNHSFHDKKILAKIEKNAVYSALDDVEGYKEKEERRSVDDDWPADPSFVSLDGGSDLSESSKSK